MTLKRYQEPAIKALKAAVAARRVAQTTLVESPVRESQSNGAVERAIRSWQGQLRTMKSHFEEDTGKKLSVNHPLMGWLVLWSGEVLMKCVVRPSGRIAHERITGHRVKHPVAMFGESLKLQLKQKESRRRKVDME